MTNININAGGYVWPSRTAINTKPAHHVSTIAQSLGNAFTPKRCGTKTSHVIFVLDDSGSMQDCRDATISGFNEYLKMQQTDAETNKITTFVSLYKFDGRAVNCVYNRLPVATVSPLTRDTYNPNGMTNLFDAIGGVMMQINNDLGSKKKADRDSVIINILTDGHENSSRSFTNQDVKQMVSKAQDKSWSFMFLGANIDAFAAGQTMGFTQHNTMQFDTKNVESTMRSASRMTNDIKSFYASVAAASALDVSAMYASTTFTDAERKEAIGDKNE
jgi:hypothetical protein